jgi:hypothetical protein
VDLGEHAQLLCRGRGVALLLEEVRDLRKRLDVVREAAQHRLELVLRLVAEAVLAEDPALGEVLGDELLVVRRQRAAQFDDRGPRLYNRRRRAAGHGHRFRRGLREVDLECPARGASLLVLEPAQLRAVLLVVRLELHQHLEDRGRLVVAAGRHVGLDHLAVGLGHEHVVLHRAVELDQLGERLGVLRVALHDLLQQRGPALDLALVRQLVDDGLQAGERVVEAAVGEIDLPELQPRVLVARVALQQRLEHLARVRGAPRAEVGLGELQRDLAVRGSGPARLLQQLDRARVVLLHDVDVGRHREQPREARPRAQRLVDELQRLGRLALLQQLVRDRDVLARRLLLVALARVEVREHALHLEVRRVELGEATQHLLRLAHAALLGVLGINLAERLARLGHQSLARVEVAELAAALDHRRVVAQHLLPDGDRLQVEAVVREVARDLDVLVVRLLELVELGVEVADAVDGVPVALVVLDDLLQQLDRLGEVPLLLRRVGVLLQLDRAVLLRCH